MARVLPFVSSVAGIKIKAALRDAFDLAPSRPIRVDSFRQGAWPKFDIIGVFLH